MMDYAFIEWWLSGKPADGNMYLLGVSFTFWLRFGHLLQLVATLTIIIDILGKDKINSIGKHLLELRNRLHRHISDKVKYFSIRREISSLVEEPEYFYVYDLIDVGKLGRLGIVTSEINKNYSEEKNSEIRKKRELLLRSIPPNSPFDYFVLYVERFFGTLGVIGFAYYTFYYGAAFPNVLEWFFFIFLAWPVFYIFSFFSVIVLYAIFLMPLFLFYYALVFPLGYILANSYFDKLALIVSLAFIVFGGAIDILLS